MVLREQQVSYQAQHNMYSLSEALAMCFGLNNPSSGPYTRQRAGIMKCQHVVRFEFLTVVLLMIQVFCDIMPCKLVKWCKRMQFTMFTDKLLAWNSYEQKDFTCCLTNSILLRFLFDMLPYC